MRKKKDRYADNATCKQLIDPKKPDYESLKGLWNKHYFPQQGAITAELGCGKGEYTLGLARRFLLRNFIGIDRKGARLWSGSQQATTEDLPNTAFLHARVEELPMFFEEGELQRLYLTFPDPYPKDRHAGRRLSGESFLRMYRQLLQPKGIVILKTDAKNLYTYTLAQLALLGLKPEQSSENLHAIDCQQHEDHGLVSTYERRALEAGRPIYYLCFRLYPTPC